MAETRVVITAQADQAIAEYERLRAASTGALQQVGNNGTQQLGRVQMSAAQTAAALRQVPAQFTDIVVSLQAGQNPLTVFLQQGGQLRDMFGSAGGAARALGGYVRTLITPYTLAAAAAATLAVAYHQGSKEADVFRESIVVTGNAAGTTASQLTGQAAAIAQSTNGIKSEAADVLAQLIRTGQVGADNMQALGEAAVRAHKDINKEIKGTVSEFEQLGKSPLETSLKLTETYHYLTLATYEQIKALQDQGRSDDAAKVAQTAYADALNSRSKDVAASLGILERGWNAVGGAARKAWDWMLDIGREDTFEQKLEKANAALEKAKRNRLTYVGAGDLGQEEQDKAQGRVDALNAEKEKSERLAAIEAGRVQLQEAGIAWDKEGDKFLTRREQLERDIAASRVRGLAAGASDADIAKRESEIRKQYSDIFNAGIDGQIEAIKRRGTIEDEFAARSMSALVAARAAGLDNSFQEQQEYAKNVEVLDQAQLSRERARLEQELRLTSQKANSDRDQAAIRGQLDDLDEKSRTRKIALTQELFNLDINAERAALGVVADSLDKRDDELRAITSQVQAQKDANAVIGMGKKEVAAYTAALVEERARRLEADAAIADTILGRENEADKLRASAKAMRELTVAQAEGAERTLDFERQKSQWEGIERTAHDTFLGIERDGKGAFDRLYDTLKNGLLELLYQMTAKQWIMNIGAQVSGYGALAGAGNAAGAVSSAGSAGTLINGASTISSAYSLDTAGFTGTVGGGISALGGWAGSAGLAEFGAGFSGSAAAEQIAATLAGETIPAMSAAASAGTALASALSTAVPWIAGAVVAYKAFDALFGDGPESDTRLTFGSNNKAGNISINERGNEGKSDAYIAGASTSSSFGTFGVTSTFWAPAESKTVQDFVKTVGMADDALAKYLTTAEKASVTSYLTGKTDTAHVGAEGQIDSADAGKALAQVFNDRIMNILEGIEPGLSKLEQGFQGTSAELAGEVESLLAYRSALIASGETVFGAKVTLQQVAALKAPTEASSAALTRITGEFAATNQAAQLLGKDMATAFGPAGLASEAARAQIILLSGGLDKFTAQVGSFAQNYLSDAERLAPVAKQLDAQLAALGLATIPQTKEQFKDLVAGLDLSSESGQKLYAGLMSLQDAFAQVHATEKTAAEILTEKKDLQTKLDELTLSEAALAEKARNAIDSHNRALYDQVVAAQAAKDALDASKAIANTLLDGVTASMSNVQSAVQREKEKLNEAYQASVNDLQSSIDTMTASVSKLQSLSQSLHSTLDSISVPGQEKSERQNAQAQITAALAIAKAGGPLPDADALKAALSTVSKDASGQFASYLDYKRDLYTTKNTVAELADFTDQKLTAEQQLLKATQDQRIALEAAHAADLASLDASLEEARAHTDLLTGINNTLLTVPQALAALGASISAVKNNPIASASAGVSSLYQSLLGRAPDAAGLAFWQDQSAAGATLDQIKNAIMSSGEYKALHPGAVPAFVNGGDHAGGLRLVGEDGPELEVTGPSRIFNATQTKAMLSTTSTDLGVEMRAQSSLMRTLITATERAATHAEATAKVFKRIGGEGDYLIVKVVPA